MRYRISGHETFPLRFAWLPKAVRGVSRDPRLLVSEDTAMVDLGVGKNMVRAIRFWAECTGVVTAAEGGGHSVSTFGQAVLGEGGRDPFLEDMRTLWLLHWQLATHEPPLLAWHFLLNQWPHPDIAFSRVLPALRREANLGLDPVADASLSGHFEVFFRLYAPHRARKGEVLEDTLDSPLVELGLLRRRDGHARDGGYEFTTGPRPEISAGLFAWSVNDFMNRRGNVHTVSFRELAGAPGSPGRIFRLAEPDLRERVSDLRRTTAGTLAEQEDLNVHTVHRQETQSSLDFLPAAYAAAPEAQP